MEGHGVTIGGPSCVLSWYNQQNKAFGCRGGLPIFLKIFPNIRQNSAMAPEYTTKMSIHRAYTAMKRSATEVVDQIKAAG